MSRFFGLLVLVLMLACAPAGAQTTGIAQAAAGGLPILAPKGTTATAQHDRSCLRVAATPFCAQLQSREFNDVDVDTYTFRTDLACCHDEEDALSSVREGAGQCSWSIIEGVHYSNDPTGMYGTFSVTCFLTGGAQDCLDPFCDNMVLSAQGPMFHINDVVTDDPRPTSVQECLEAKFNSSRTVGLKAGNNPTQRSERRPYEDPVQSGTKEERRRGPANTLPHTKSDGTSQLYHIPYAHMLSGPMTVYDRLSGKKWDGWLDAVYYLNSGNAKPISEAEAAGKTFLRPNDILLKQFKQLEY